MIGTLATIARRRRARQGRRAGGRRGRRRRDACASGCAGSTAARSSANACWSRAPANSRKRSRARCSGRGAEPILAPTIAIERAGRRDLPRNAPSTRSRAYAWIVFTSQNGVDAFFERLARARRRRARARRRKGRGDRRATAERLRDYGVAPTSFRRRSSAKRSPRGDRAAARRRRVLRLPRARGARRAAADARGGGPARRRSCRLQNRRSDDPDFAQKVERADVLTFTSASTVRGFADAARRRRRRRRGRARQVRRLHRSDHRRRRAARSALHVDVVADALHDRRACSTRSKRFFARCRDADRARRALAAAVAAIAYRARALSRERRGRGVRGRRDRLRRGRLAGGRGAVRLLHSLDAALARRRGAQARAARRTHGARNAWQVLANGGVAALCALAGSLRGTRRSRRHSPARSRRHPPTRGEPRSARSRAARRSRSSRCAARSADSRAASRCSGSSRRSRRRAVRRRRCGAHRLGPACSVVVGGIAGALLDSVLGASLQALRWCPACDCECETRRHRAAPLTSCGAA